MKYIYDFEELSILRNILFEIYTTEKLNYRKRKQVLRGIFNCWYKTISQNGDYNEDYWKLKFDDSDIISNKNLLNIFVRSFLFDNIKGLSIPQQYKMFRLIFEHKKINESKSNS